MSPQDVEIMLPWRAQCFVTYFQFPQSSNGMHRFFRSGVEPCLCTVNRLEYTRPALGGAIRLYIDEKTHKMMNIYKIQETNPCQIRFPTIVACASLKGQRPDPSNFKNNLLKFSQLLSDLHGEESALQSLTFCLLRFPTTDDLVDQRITIRISG